MGLKFDPYDHIFLQYFDSVESFDPYNWSLIMCLVRF